MRKVLFLCFLFLSFKNISAQVWEPVTDDQVAIPSEERSVIPIRYSTWKLDIQQLRENLPGNNPILLQIPTPNGKLRTFRVDKLNNWPEELSRKFPNIISFQGSELDMAGNRIKGDISVQGFRAVVSIDGEEVYIDPYSRQNQSYYISYFTKDHQIDPWVREQYAKYHHHASPDTTQHYFDRPNASPFQRSNANEVELRIYDAAIACTGEYSNKHGGTKEGALAAINTALNRINFLLETEVAIQLRLIPNNDELVFTDSDNDPYTNGNASMMAIENNNHLISEIGAANYDIGHVFGTGCVGVAGVSGGIGIACGGMKGYGSSCELFTDDRFYIGIICHELGHQFGAEHTWNNCPGSEDQINTGTAFEPGSGSTIMSYAGACGNQNIQFNSDSYYHNNSIVAIQNYTTTGPGAACAEVVTTLNNRPEINLDIESGFYIPISTPFRLEADGTDIDGDTLTYSWEQYDPGIGNASMTDISNPVGNAPIFRSQKPTIDGIRYFPDLPFVLAGQSNPAELLPTYNRKLTFRVTVRDHRLGGGGFAFDELSFSTTDKAGPFEVMNLASDTLIAGEFLTLNWSVANSNQTPVNCALVNIKLSLDGGLTFPITLVENTLNDGEEGIVIPNIATDVARIMVEAADNIFFQINSNDLTIQEAQIPSFGFDLFPRNQRICLPTQANIRFLSNTWLGFTDQLQIEVADLPEGVDYQIDTDNLKAGDSTQINLDFTNFSQNDIFVLSVKVISSTDTFVRPVVIETVSNDFSSIQTLSPVAASGVERRPQFNWEASGNAENYQLQISKSPAFANALTYSSESTSLEIDSILDQNEIYFWRVRGANVCGIGDYESLSAFHTINLSCETYESEDLPQSLSQSSIATVESIIDISTIGMVSDVNISSITGFHESFGDLKFKITSPGGQEVLLIEDQCGFSNRQIDFGFDDDSPLPFNCQTSFAGQIFQPTENLTVLEGEEINGQWKLIVIDSTIGSGGIIDSWSFEVCGAVTGQVLSLINNDTAILLKNIPYTLNETDLLVTGDQSGPENIIYTIVTLPASGLLLFNEEEMVVGQQFSQTDLNEGFVNIISEVDSGNFNFSFVVESNNGAWLPIQQFHFIIDNSVNESSIDLPAFKVYPNPAKDILNISPLFQKLDQVEVFDVTGRLVYRKDNLPPKINIESWNAGTYWLRVSFDQGFVIREFTVVK